MTGGELLVLGIDPGDPGKAALAACAILSLDEGAGSIGVFRPAIPLRKASLAPYLEGEPLLADPRLRLAAVAAPLTPRPLDRKPWKARAVEIRLSRGAFASSSRGPNMPWISKALSWVRYEQARPLLAVLEARGFSLLAMPGKAPACELPLRCTAEVFPKASLAVLAPADAPRDRPFANEFMSQLDDWLFPRLFTATHDAAPPIVARLEALAPGLHLARETLGEAQRIGNLRRPSPRREPLRAFVAALQGILAVRGAACLVGAAGDHEGSILLPAAWDPDWETEWSDLRRDLPELRRIPLESPCGFLAVAMAGLEMSR
jgi:hypothetical protein